MRNGGDRQLLQSAVGAQQRARSDGEDAVQFVFPHSLEKIPAQNARQTPAARSARVHILLFRVVDQHPAVKMLRRDVEPAFREQFVAQLRALRAEIAGNDRVKVLEPRLAVIEIP